MKIGLITASGANLMSWQNALANYNVQSLSSPEQITKEVKAIFLPGVGHSSSTLKKIKPWNDFLLTTSIPVLGICIGMQAFYKNLEESQEKGLGLFSGSVKKIPIIKGQPVPHMGWNHLNLTESSPLFYGLDDASFYFVHSYACPVQESITLATVDYNGIWSAVIQKDHFTGVQFHPEKSGSAGQRFIYNYLETLK